ncbi:MAG TPA: phosphoribosyl-ATP diphosphatase [Hyphomicrobium sp.]|jgi:phosphoribosyl-ATP pyrophosphohydrolase|nr:phosphoribosyl-ATP diphosphatase [Hyphomicrobium sp.]
MSETNTLERLAALIRSRRSDSTQKSYTAQLLTAGTERCAKKFGEEAVETVIAAMTGDAKALKAEAADTLYHLLVLLESREVAFADVLKVLDGRMGTSGLEEKASRPGSSS